MSLMSAMPAVIYAYCIFAYCVRVSSTVFPWLYYVAQTHSVTAWGQVSVVRARKSDWQTRACGAENKDQRILCVLTRTAVCVTVQQQSEKVSDCVITVITESLCVECTWIFLSCALCYIYLVTSSPLIALFRANAALFLCLQCLSHSNSVPCLSCALWDIYSVTSSLFLSDCCWVVGSCA